MIFFLCFVAATSNGAAGDSGFRSNLGLVAHSRRDIRARIQSLGRRYRAVVNSRKVVRQAPSTVITHAEAMAPGMSLGLDNRALLPPFMPEFSNEDGGFGRVLNLSCTDAYIAHLPFTVIHDPAGIRRNYISDEERYRMSDVVGWCLSSWAGANGGSTGDRLTSLGAHLRQISALPDGELTEVLSIMVCTNLSAQAQSLEAVLAGDGYKPANWAQDLASRLEKLRHSLERGVALPDDVRCRPGVKPVPTIRFVLKSYADLLEWWPAIAHAARQLNEGGLSLGRPLTCRK